MSILRSINPTTGYMQDFQIKADEPILLGTLNLDRALKNLDAILVHVPAMFKTRIREYIERAKFSIEMEICKISYKYISRAHCMVFPGETPQIVDLFSKNGTRIAGLDGGIPLDPGRKTDLKPDDIVLLASGRAVFQYIHPQVEHEGDAINRVLTEDTAVREILEADLPPFVDSMHSP
ncbi:hypothetical protein ACFL9T_01235 [Thermodesulfobacteriota bacterium]